MLRSFKSLLAAGLILVANPAAAQDDPRIVAVNHPLQYIAERLMGGAGDVVFPVPGGAAGIEDQFITTESITHSHGDGGEHSHEGLASYLWLDPTLAAAQAEAVAAAITAKNLAPSGDVASRLDALRADLDALDTQTRAAVQGLQDVTLIATHPRYEYFARMGDAFGGDELVFDPRRV